MDDLLIIGGGIGGLAAAHAAQTQWRAAGRTPQITVCEAAPRWGGVIASERRDGCLIEHGPDAVLTAKPAALDLMRAVGLGADIIGTEPTARRACVARGRHIIPIPDGLYLFGPGRIWPFLWSSVVSVPGKLRMLADLWIPARRDAGDESLGAFVRRRLGREALERLAQPMAAAIYGGDPDQLSLLATMPQFAAMERDHGGVIRALRARKATVPAASGPRYGLFATLRGGMQTLIESLVASLDDCQLCLNSPVTRLVSVGDHWHATWSDGTVHAAARVIVALPAPAAARLLRDVDRLLAAGLAAIPYRDVTTVSCAVTPAQVPRLPMCAGFVVPAVEGRAISAATCASRKFAGRAPDDRLLLRTALPCAAEGALAWAAVQRDLAELIGLEGTVAWHTSRTWHSALPEYRVGHGERVAHIRTLVAALPGLDLVGNAYDGSGISDVIAGATAAVTRLIRRVEPVGAEV